MRTTALLVSSGLTVWMTLNCSSREPERAADLVLRGGKVATVDDAFSFAEAVAIEVLEVSQSVAIGSVIEDILLLAECSLENEWAGQIRYVPL